MAVRFERDGRKERGLEAVCTAFADDAAKAAQGGASAGLLVVRQLVQVVLDRRRRLQPRDEPSLAGRVYVSCQSPAPGGP
jgi:hypothetical protein